MMTTLAMLFGLLMATIGAVGIASPKLVIRFAECWQSQAALYAAMAIRLVMGVTFIAVAPASHFPHGLCVFGAIVVISGLLLPFVGVERLKRCVAWWMTRSDLIHRAWACMALAIGASVIWAVAL